MTRSILKHRRLIVFCLFLAVILAGYLYLHSSNVRGVVNTPETTLESLSKEYHIREGSKNRASYFEHLALGLAEEIYNGEMLPCNDALLLLGTPDGTVLDSGGQGMEIWIYKYTKNGKQGGVVICEVEPSKMRIVRIGFGDIGVLRNMQIEPYEAVAVKEPVKPPVAPDEPQK